MPKERNEMEKTSLNLPAIKVLTDLEKFKQKSPEPIELYIKRNLMESETECHYYHGTSWETYFFKNGKFWREYSYGWASPPPPPWYKKEGCNQPDKMTPEQVLELNFKTYDMDYYGGAKSFIESAHTKDLLKKAKAIANYIEAIINKK